MENNSDKNFIIMREAIETIKQETKSKMKANKQDSDKKNDAIHKKHQIFVSIYDGSDSNF